MKERLSKLISGLLAFGVYVTLIGLLLYYFNTHKSKESLHYVKKNEERIRVSLSSPTKIPKDTTKIKPTIKPKPKSTPKLKEKSKPKPKLKLKPKPKPKPKPKAKVKPKPVHPKNLFANIPSGKPSKEKPHKREKKSKGTTAKESIVKVSHTPSASELISNSLKRQKSSDRGVEKAYFAKIEERLRGWPAQSEYAGERAKVWFRVESNGAFVFKVITASNNEDFNRGLIAYLKQLQRFGFGSHSGKRAYQLEVEFIAKE